MTINVTSRRAVLRLSGAAIAGVAGCSGRGAQEQATVEMTDQMRFDPESVTVSTGGTVTWTNVGQVDHTVTAYEEQLPADATFFASGGFDAEQTARRNISAGLIGPEETFAHTLEISGTYEYFCIPHEGAGMTGTVTVE